MNPDTDRLPRMSGALREEVRITAAAFAALIVLGYALSILRPESTEALLAYVTGSFQAAGADPLSGGEMMVMLLINNLFTAVTTMLSGIVPFLRLPAFTVGINAVLLGAFAARYQTSGIGIAAFLAGTLPHGIPELTALVIACAAGLHLCRTVTDRLRGREGTVSIGEAWRDCSRAYVRYIFPLLAVAAAVEAFITPRLFASVIG